MLSCRNVFRVSVGIGLLWAVVEASAATYYVEPDGDDARSGLSTTSAWATIQHAVSSVAAGDEIVVLPGTYSGARIEVSGTTNAPITLRAETPGTVFLRAPGPANRHGGIIEIETWGGNQVVSGWRIVGFSITNSPWHGIDARSTQYLAILSNRVQGCARTGIFAAFSYDVVISGNSSASNGEHGVYYNNSGDRFVLSGNTLHHNANCGLHMNGDNSVAPPAGSPWVFDGTLSDGVVENNVIYKNGTGGAGINMDGVTRSTVRNNLIHASPNNSGIALYRIDGAVSSSGNRIANNTILMAANGGWAITLADAACVSNTILNNIALSGHSFRGSIAVAASNTVGFACDHNVVMDRFSIDGGDTRIGLDAWRALGYDTHSVIASPSALFVDPAGDYHLLTNSPAIDRGSEAPDVVCDVEGSGRPLDGDGDGTNRWDVGAYEFSGKDSDSDGDGMSDLSEWIAGTDPLDAGDVFVISGFRVPDPGEYRMYWASHAGRRYSVLSGVDPAAGFSVEVTNLEATPPSNSYTGAPPAAAVRLYRISVTRP